MTLSVSKDTAPFVAGSSILACLIALSSGLLAIVKSPKSVLGWLGLVLALSWFSVFSGALWRVIP